MNNQTARASDNKGVRSTEHVRLTRPALASPAPGSARGIRSATGHLSPFDSGGFTLLELLIVVFILAALAFTTVSFTDNADSQFRYEETQRRLQSIRRAIAGDTEPTFAGQRLLSGYVADIGALPTTLTSLTVQPPGFDAYAAQTPLFDPHPDSTTGFNDGGEICDGGICRLTERLFKGFRGNYLSLTPGTTQFRDGWGNVGQGGVGINCPCSSTGLCPNPNLGNDVDANNHGWCVTYDAGTPDEIYIESYGADAQTGGSNFDKDLTTSVLTNDWTHDIDNNLTVKVTNTSATTSWSGAPGLGVSLLAYGIRSDGTPGWKRLSTPITSLATDSSVELTFVATSLSSIDSHIPIGQHILVLFEDDDSTPQNGSGGETPNISQMSGKQFTKIISFFPHTVLPDNIELVIQ